MSNHRWLALRTLFVVLALGLAACTESGKVVQGKVVGFDSEQRLVTIVGDDGSSAPVTYALPSDPKDVGPLPTTGDMVRIYYKEDGKALRFMNVTRTDIYKK